MRTVSWLENLKVRDHSENLGVDEKIILERVKGNRYHSVFISPSSLRCAIGLTSQHVMTTSVHCLGFSLT